MCIKFGGNIVRNEEAYLISHPLLWIDKVRHIGNIIDKDYNEVNYCTFKKIDVYRICLIKKSIWEDTT